ncbi:MAG: glycosyltransferase family 2 protein [Lachnospiraceae bacterium]|nr:glycosyltransferase family 2 protein [Lachnospiraceae bacterium]
MAETVLSGGDLTHIVAALCENPKTLAARMHLAADAVIVNQCNENSRSEYVYEGHRIRVVNSAERGVGRSRNQGLLLCETPYVLIGDEDIVYEDGYADTVLQEFEKHPEADILLFNVIQSRGRETYHNTDYHRIRFYNCGRYPAYSIALRTERIAQANVWFSLLFGGGAKYAAGEDSLFLMDCLRKKLRIYRTTPCLGHETERESTWFAGFDDKFFRDRGTLYRALYGFWAPLIGLCFLRKNRREWLADRSFGEAWSLMRQGMR